MRQLQEDPLEADPGSGPSLEGVDLVGIMLEGDEGSPGRTALFKFVIHGLSNVEDVAVRVRVELPDGSLDAAALRAWHQLAERLAGATVLAREAGRGRRRPGRLAGARPGRRA